MRPTSRQASAESSDRRRNTGLGINVKHIVIHIDRLVLKGFRSEDRHAITADLQQERTRVIADDESVALLQA